MESVIGDPIVPINVGIAATNGYESTSSCKLVLGKALHRADSSESMFSWPVGRTRVMAVLPEPTDLCC